MCREIMEHIAFPVFIKPCSTGSSNDRNSSKSDKEQARLVRRIVEKRQAQAAHHKIGRTDDLYASKVSRGNACRCMSAIRQQMYALSDMYSA